MKFLDEYRRPEVIGRLADEICRLVTHQWTIMEVCGGQTHAIMRHGLDQLLAEKITLVHGPGCPVCVTAEEMIDKAVALARRPGVILCSYGDMVRVPGSGGDLLSARAAGGQVRLIYSPMDALAIALDNPESEVVLFAIGFETTAPGNAAAVAQAHRAGLRNFSILSAQVLVPPAMRLIVSAPDHGIDAFLAAGHVCSVSGEADYRSIVSAFNLPIVITGFEPADILLGIREAVRQLEGGTAEMNNAYRRAVRSDGNKPARQLVAEVFEAVDREWRGLGIIPKSGLALRSKYAAFDAEKRFDLSAITSRTSSICRTGAILRGKEKPTDCSAFGRECTPAHPLGASMVSAEGACAAYYQYKQRTSPE